MSLVEGGLGRDVFGPAVGVDPALVLARGRTAPAAVRSCRSGLRAALVAAAARRWWGYHLAPAAPSSACRRPRSADRLGAQEVARLAAPITEKPRGLSRSEAILARNLLAPRPIETVMPISASISPAAAPGSRRRRAVQPLGARKVEPGLVQRQRLDQRRQRRAHAADRAGSRAVLGEVRLDDHGLRAELPAP